MPPREQPQYSREYADPRSGYSPSRGYAPSSPTPPTPQRQYVPRGYSGQGYAPEPRRYGGDPERRYPEGGEYPYPGTEYFNTSNEYFQERYESILQEYLGGGYGGYPENSVRQYRYPYQY